jgi:hypothetical protein
MMCLKKHGNVAEECREAAKVYLQCRMERWASAVFLTILHNLEIRKLFC